MKQLLLSLCLFLGSAAASAHMVTYKGGLGIMSFNDPDMGVFEVNYTFHPEWAIVYRHMSWIPDEPPGLEETLEKRDFAQVNYRLRRWNNPDSQGNVYLGAAIGDQGAKLGQIEADWEDRQYYIASEYQVIDLDDDQGPYAMTKLRLGMAPYIANSGALHSWLIFQYGHNELLEDQDSLTPFIRLFYESMLVEIGSSFDGGLSFNFMAHF